MYKTLTATELADVLASGKYRKGSGCLKDDEQYCCLGVYAAECGMLHDNDFGEGYVTYGDGDKDFDRLGCLAPAWMKRPAYTIHGEVGDVENALINVNDDCGDWQPIIDLLRSL